MHHGRCKKKDQGIDKKQECGKTPHAEWGKLPHRTGMGRNAPSSKRNVGNAGNEGGKARVGDTGQLKEGSGESEGMVVVDQGEANGTRE